jgi:hypothetical protein
MECPRSYISAESVSLLETYAVWDALGQSATERMPARVVDAILTLRAEEAREKSHGEQQK